MAYGAKCLHHVTHTRLSRWRGKIPQNIKGALRTPLQMQLSSVLVAAAVAAGVSAKKNHDPASTTTTTFYGSTNTHRYGRFDKTKRSLTSSSSGTHKYGKFDKTKRPVTTTVFVVNRAVSNSSGAANGTLSSSAAGAFRAAAPLGIAGAAVAGLLLI